MRRGRESRNTNKIMTLAKLHSEVQRVLELVEERGKDPAQILVTLQLENLDGAQVWGHEGVEITWDNDCQACGCVISGIIST